MRVGWNERASRDVQESESEQRVRAISHECVSHPRLDLPQAPSAQPCPQQARARRCAATPGMSAMNSCRQPLRILQREGAALRHRAGRASARGRRSPGTESGRARMSFVGVGVRSSFRREWKGALERLAASSQHLAVSTAAVEHARDAVAKSCAWRERVQGSVTSHGKSCQLPHARGGGPRGVPRSSPRGGVPGPAAVRWDCRGGG